MDNTNQYIDILCNIKTNITTFCNNHRGTWVGIIRAESCQTLPHCYWSPKTEKYLSGIRYCISKFKAFKKLTCWSCRHLKLSLRREFWRLRFSISSLYPLFRRHASRIKLKFLSHFLSISIYFNRNWMHSRLRQEEESVGPEPSEFSIGDKFSIY